MIAKDVGQPRGQKRTIQKVKPIFDRYTKMLVSANGKTKKVSFEPNVKRARRWLRKELEKEHLTPYEELINLPKSEMYELKNTQIKLLRDSVPNWETKKEHLYKKRTCPILACQNKLCSEAEVQFHITFYHGHAKQCEVCESRFRNYTAFNQHKRQGHVCDMKNLTVLNRKLKFEKYSRTAHGTDIHRVYGLVWRDKKGVERAMTIGETQYINVTQIATLIIANTKRALAGLKASIQDDVYIDSDDVDGCGGVKKALEEGLIPDLKNPILFELYGATKFMAGHLKFYVRQYTNAYRIFGGVDSLLILKEHKEVLDSKIKSLISKFPKPNQQFILEKDAVTENPQDKSKSK